MPLGAPGFLPVSVGNLGRNSCTVVVNFPNDARHCLARDRIGRHVGTIGRTVVSVHNMHLRILHGCVSTDSGAHVRCTDGFTKDDGC